MKTAAILPSAGSGRRMNSRIDKPFMKLCGRDIISYALGVFQKAPFISEIIIAAKDENIGKIEAIAKARGFNKVKRVIKGGRRRFQSVYNALSEVSPDIDYVIVHDCARPLVTEALILKALFAAKRYGASITAVRVKPTIKQAQAGNDFVKKTLNRTFLWETQTPQAFKKDILINAYKAAVKKSSDFTDCASIVERTGRPVKIVEGSYSNIKITTPEDLVIAEAILKNSKLKTQNSKLQLKTQNFRNIKDKT